MERGKVDIFINCEDYTQDNVSLKYNEALAAQYLTYLNSMAAVSYTHLDVYKRQGYGIRF